jgi:hypothetical protein
MVRSMVALAVTLLLSTAGIALAGGDGSWTNRTDSPWYNYWNDWHRNDLWMCPFNCPDRASVWNMFDAEVAKGWEAQNTLTAAHFENDNNRLSTAGQMKVHWILTQNPSPFRTVFVAPGWDAEVASRRLAAAQAGTARMVGPGPMPGVFVSNMDPITTSADYVAGVNTWFGTYMTGIPKPQPEAFQNSDTGTSGSQ